MAAPRRTSAAAGLKPSLGALDVTVLTLSALSPAASVFITGSGILHMAGTGAAIALPVGGAAIVVGSLLYAELGSAFPSAGGFYPGLTRVLGGGAGSAALALALVTSPAVLAFIALGFADYMRVLVPALPRLPLAEGALAAALILSVFNIRTNAWITGAFLAAEMIAVLGLTVVAATHVDRSLGETLRHPMMATGAARLVPTPGWTVALACVAGAFACSGSTLAIYFSEDLKRAPTGVGRLIVGVGVAAAVLVGAPLVLMTLDARNLATTLASEAPIALFLSDRAGPAVAYAATAAVALAILNNIIASLLAFSRFLYATGRDGVWLAPINVLFSRLHPRFGSPWRAAAALGVGAGALCLLGEQSLLILLSGEVFTATFVIAAVLVGRRRGVTGASTFRSPLYPVLPILGFAIVAAFLVADWHDARAGRWSVLLLAGVVVLSLLRHAVRARRRRPSGKEALSPTP